MATPRQSGILPFQKLRTFVRQGAIHADVPIASEQIQPASIDLRLGAKAYRLLSSFLPEPSDQQEQFTIEDLYRSDLVMYDMDLSKGAILEKGHVYLVPLMEQLKLPKDVRGRTNPKSSTGRLDIFTRVVTDLHVGFDEIRSGYHGMLFLEIVPRSFTIRIHEGLALNQLRLLSGKPLVSDASLRSVHRKTPLLCHNGEDGASDRPLSVKDLRVDNGLFLRVDLQGNADQDKSIVGYRAKKNSHIIDLSKVGHYAASDYWEPLYRNDTSTLLLEPEEFYILASKERIHVPPGYSAEMVAYEAACGELRTHYAGFFDPGFGYANPTRQGTQVVLEVRPHDVPFRIHDGQTFFKVMYEHMQAVPTHLYGSSMGSSYSQQGLTLSKHFKW